MTHGPHGPGCKCGTKENEKDTVLASAVLRNDLVEPGFIGSVYEFQIGNAATIFVRLDASTYEVTECMEFIRTGFGDFFGEAVDAHTASMVKDIKGDLGSILDMLFGAVRNEPKTAPEADKGPSSKEEADKMSTQTEDLGGLGGSFNPFGK